MFAAVARQLPLQCQLKILKYKIAESNQGQIHHTIPDPSNNYNV